MTNNTGGTKKVLCPNCGATMFLKRKYSGGTAEKINIISYSSSGSASSYMYREHDVYSCTNPKCGKELLAPHSFYDDL